MRRTPLLLALSLTANAALAVALWPRISPLFALVSSASTSNPRPTSSSLTPAPPTETERWQQLTSIADDTVYVAALRAESFPPEIIRALVRNRIHRRYASRLLALRRQTPPQPYWQTAQLGHTWYNPDAAPAILAEQRAIFMEIEDTLQSLLGADADRVSHYQRERHARTYGSLPASKISAIEAINRDYGEMGMQLRAASKGVTLAADRERIAFLERERRADIERALTPEELDEYDRRNSLSAVEIRNKFRFFDGTEGDFLALYALQRDFDARYGRMNLSGEAEDRRAAALPELEKQFETALGAERYADYLITTDGNFSATQSTLDQLGLPPEKSKDLVRIQRDANKRAAAIRADKSLNADQRATQLASLHKEASEKVTAELGTAENLAAYNRWPGQWLAKLNPPSSPSAR